jgi:hypothetical protein
MRRGVQPGERQRDADVVVEVTLGGDDAARSATEEERQQVLGRGLACTA